MLPNPQFPADLAIFTEKIQNGKLHFFCSVLPEPFGLNNSSNAKTLHTYLWSFES